MVGVEEIEALKLEYQKIEELLEDKDSKYFDKILLNGPIDAAKNKLKIIKDQGAESHGVFSS